MNNVHRYPHPHPSHPHPYPYPHPHRYQYEVGWLVEELKTPASHGYWDEQRAMYRASKGCGCGAKPAGTRGQRAAGTI